MKFFFQYVCGKMYQESGGQHTINRNSIDVDHIHLRLFVDDVLLLVGNYQNQEVRYFYEGPDNNDIVLGREANKGRHMRTVLGRFCTLQLPNHTYSVGYIQR